MTLGHSFLVCFALHKNEQIKLKLKYIFGCVPTKCTEFHFKFHDTVPMELICAKLWKQELLLFLTQTLVGFVGSSGLHLQQRLNPLMVNLLVDLENRCFFFFLHGFRTNNFWSC